MTTVVVERTFAEPVAFEEIQAIEERTHHDVIAFLENVASSVGPAARWMHQGLTSSDVLDTCLGVQLSRSCDILRADLVRLREVVAGRAREHKWSVAVGRGLRSSRRPSSSWSS